MRGYNKVILMGNLTRDPQLKFLPSQTAVAEFGLAVNREWKDAQTGEQRKEVCFIECAAFGKGGETINTYCRKGKPLFIEGRLKFDQWEDKQGGGKRSKLTVVVDNFQFLGDGRDGAAAGPGGAPGEGYDADPEGGPPAPRQQRPPMTRPASNGGAAPSSAPRPATRPPAAPAEPPPYSNDEGFKDDDIPF